MRFYVVSRSRNTQELLIRSLLYAPVILIVSKVIETINVFIAVHFERGVSSVCVMLYKQFISLNVCAQPAIKMEELAVMMCEDWKCRVNSLVMDYDWKPRRTDDGSLSSSRLSVKCTYTPWTFYCNDWTKTREFLLVSHPAQSTSRPGKLVDSASAVKVDVTRLVNAHGTNLDEHLWKSIQSLSTLKLKKIPFE